MSGGVDSSVAAATLLRQGCEVIGVFMRLGSPGETLDTPIADDALRGVCNAEAHDEPGRIKIGKQGCCSINDAADARLVAAELGIPFYVVNFKKEFGRIIDYFVGEYAAGRTPNPCVRCNDWLKFGRLHEYAQSMGAGFVASGHHARVAVRNGSPALLRGVDEPKDQSYVLFGAPRDRLAEMLLPVGEMTKDEVRDKAEELGLPTFDKPDSQEICFVPDNDYAGLVERRRPDLARSGRIVDERGETLGEHSGQHRFTIGQRRGVGVALGHPIFVVGKDPETNTVTVGERASLLSTCCIAAEANWLIKPPAPGERLRVVARYRAHGHDCPATVRVLPDLDAPTPSGRSAAFGVEFDEPQEAVAPGQAIVLYDASEPARVLGGGWIVRAGAAT